MARRWKTSHSLAKWRKLAAAERDAQAMLSLASQRLREHVAAHLRGHPLSDRVKESLVQMLRDGQPLCCDVGRKNLAEARLVDEIWAEVINAWAHEHSGCRPGEPQQCADGLAVALRDGNLLDEQARGLYG